MSADDGDIIFTGGSAEEAEDFIFAVKKRAYQKGKHKDNVWITEFVSICFAKKALRWYARLDPEIRNDWELLTRAILDEYEEPSIPSSLVPTSASILQGSTLKTIPAAGPPIRTGRIRVDSEFNQLRGYISKTFVVDGVWCSVSADKSDASIFEFDGSAHTIKFQGNSDDYLAVRAHEINWDLRKGSNHLAALTRNQGRTVAARSGWSDEVQVDLWSVVDQNKLVGRWSLKAGGFWELEGSALTSDKRIYLTPDYQAFSQRYGSTSYKALALYFEASS